jgi:glutamate-ammonia-ligase adenylyltransferase
MSAVSANNVHGLFESRITVNLPRYDDQEETIKAGTDTLLSLVENSCANAPYLKLLVDKSPEIIDALANISPETLCQKIYADIKSEDFDELCAQLRQAKGKLHLLTAMCDLAGVWSWEVVTQTLSTFADVAMERLITIVARDMGFEATERGPVPGLFVLALGKYGARELNYSSDIDLIVFYDPDDLALPDPHKAERILVRFVKKLMQGFHRITPDGYVFRTDLRLRPDPRANAIAVSTHTAERYYETLGQNWERAAMIKARYCGGDKSAAEHFIASVLTPFIWRKNLDFAAIEDIHSIKRQIQGGAQIDNMVLAGHDVKLGLGGIREIEFFTQVQQLILGGRHKDLRSARTIDSLANLARGGYISSEIAQQLTHDYGVLRDCEHRIQMYGDAHTHMWPRDTAHRNQLAALCGASELNLGEKELVATLHRVHKAYENLFPDEENLGTEYGHLMFTGVEPEPETLKTLAKFGFLRGPEIWRHMSDWLGGRIHATRTPRSRELLTRLAPRLIETCAKNTEPDIAFFNFSRFVSDINAGVSLFSLLLNNENALRILIDIMVLSPALANVLSAQPALIGAMAEPAFLTQNIEHRQPRYDVDPYDVSDFEACINAVRRAVHEDQLSLIVGLLQTQNIDFAGDRFSAIAESAVCALAPIAEYSAFGSERRQSGDYAILALGKLGSREMSYSSDLDIMVIYEAHDDEAVPKYNKFTRRLISALSATTEEGRLYDVDMALRPSGRSGPLAVSLNAFGKYYEKDAWTWEFMALCRARIVYASSADVSRKLEKNITNLLVREHDPDVLRGDILDMHERLHQEKPARGDWDVKRVKGGLRDIEFICQYLLLKHRPSQRIYSTLEVIYWAQSEEWISDDDAVVLGAAFVFYRDFIQICAMTIEGMFDPQEVSSVLHGLVTQNANCQNFEDMETLYSSHVSQISKLFSTVFEVQ